MAIVTTDNTNYQNIASAIRQYNEGDTSYYKPSEMAEGVAKVYAKGAEDGAKSVMERFQDACENRSYKYAFSGYGWNNDTFNPVRNIILKNGADHVFHNTYDIALKAQLEKNNVQLDTSQMTNMDYVFYQALQGTENLETHIIPPIGNDNVTSAAQCFYLATGLYAIEKFTISPTCAGLNNAFFRCDQLRSVTFGNTIRTNLVLTHSPKLTHECILHILGQLEETSTTLTLTLGATNLAKLTDEEKAIATEKGWTLA